LTGLVGWAGAGRSGDHVYELSSPDIVARMLDAGHAHEGSARQSEAVAAAGIGAQGWSSDVSVHSAGDILAVVYGRARWRGEKYRQRAVAQGGAAALIEAWRDKGISLFDIVGGPASFAIVDSARHEALVAIDRIGVQQMSFATTPAGAFVFASDARAVCSHPALNPDISRQALFNYLYFYISPGPATVFEDIEKLQPGQYAHFRNGAVSRSFYWQPAYTEFSDRDDGACAEQVRDSLRDGVGAAVAAVPGAEPGAFLSGGLDSTSVAGYLAGHRPGAKGFTIAFPEEKYNELPWAEAGARRFGIDHVTHVLTPAETVDAIPGIVEAHDEPYGNSSSVPAYICARVARDNGVGLLLAGDGGDEIFAGNERYVEQRRYDAWRRIPSPFRRLLHGLLLNGAGRNTGDGVLARATAYANRAETPLPDRLQAYNIIATSGLSRLFHPDFLAAIDPGEPLRIAREIYHRPDGATELKRMQFLDLHITLADNDLRKVNRACELAGVRVAYPMLDEDLVSFAAAIPSATLLPQRRLRGFYKDTMAGFLPPEILSKQKHGFGMPFSEWTRAPGDLRDMAEEGLRAFATRDILADGIIDEIRSDLTGVRESRFGGLIWDVMMLELWLSRHSDIATLH
tara:strand:+ start:2021 stop:3904 length:1884 start_codon:yes stop_codon:yes gene_type:complete